MNNEITAYYDFINSTAEEDEYIPPVLLEGYIDNRDRNIKISKTKAVAREVFSVIFNHIKGVFLFGIGILAGIGAGGIVLHLLHMSW